MAATTTELGLVTPTQGTLSGTWGDTVNNGITEYTNIAIAATLTLTGDGAVTLANTTGSASATNITSTLTGAGTVTAQFAIVKVTGTLTTPKIITAPSYSKTYVVVNAATGSTVSFIRSGQTPAVSIAVGESAYVYYNGTDYVKLSSTVATGVTSFQTSLSGLTPSTSTTGAVTLAGTLGTANGGTNLTSFTANGVVYASSTSALATGSALTFDGTNLSTTGSISTSSTNGYNVQISGGNAYRMYADANNMIIRSVTGSTDVMTFGYSGNVGIGTASPTTQLEIKSAAFTDSQITLDNTSSNTTSRILFKAAGTEYGRISGDSTQVTIQSGNIPLVFRTNSAERARIDTAGYLSGVWADEVSALGSSGATKTITCTAGNVFTCTLSQSCTFTLSAPSTTTASTATSFTLILTNGGAGYTVAWSGGTFKYPGGSVTRTTASGAIDIWFFFSPDGGTTWYVSIPMANLS